MPASQRPTGGLARRDLMLLLLAVAGAGVDAVIILAFGVLTAAQTGNTILLAVSLAQGQLAAGLRGATSVVGYVVGAAVGELIVVRNRESTPWPSAVDWALVAELVPLGCLAILWHLAGPNAVQGWSLLLVALAAIAMGIQSAAVLRLHAGPTTTYITGTLTTFTTEVIQRLQLVESSPVASPVRQDRGPGHAPSGGGPWLYGITWLVYAAGAVVAGLLYLRVGETALLLPMLVIVAVVAAEARRT